MWQLIIFNEVNIPIGVVGNLNGNPLSRTDLIRILKTIIPIENNFKPTCNNSRLGILEKTYISDKHYVFRLQYIEAKLLDENTNKLAQSKDVFMKAVIY